MDFTHYISVVKIKDLIYNERRSVFFFADDLNAPVLKAHVLQFLNETDAAFYPGKIRVNGKMTYVTIER